MYSTYGGVSATPSQISGARQHLRYAEPHTSNARGRGGNAGRRQEGQRKYFDPYAAAKSADRSDSRSASSGSSSASSDGGSREEVGKKLVVQYSLVRDPRSENNGSSTSAYSDAYGAPMVKDEVKVKARVEVSEMICISAL